MLTLVLFSLSQVMIFIWHSPVIKMSYLLLRKLPSSSTSLQHSLLFVSWVSIVHGCNLIYNLSWVGTIPPPSPPIVAGPDDTCSFYHHGRLSPERVGSAWPRKGWFCFHYHLGSTAVGDDKGGLSLTRAPGKHFHKVIMHNANPLTS